MMRKTFFTALGACALAAIALPAQAQTPGPEAQLAARCLVLNSLVLGGEEGTLSAEEETGLVGIVLFWTGQLSARVDGETFDALAVEQARALAGYFDAGDSASVTRIEQECTSALTRTTDRLEALAARLDALE